MGGTQIQWGRPALFFSGGRDPILQPATCHAHKTLSISCAQLKMLVLIWIMVLMIMMVTMMMMENVYRIDISLSVRLHPFYDPFPIP